MAAEQLSLELEPALPNPNAHFFNADGSMKRLMWCSDTTRIAFNAGLPAPCPYTEEHPRSRVDAEMLSPVGVRFLPAGGCCKDLVR